MLRGRPQLRPAAGVSSLDASSWRPYALVSGYLYLEIVP